ncbi:hypothetical protein DM02DRAFT_503082, partial [Periconia macrospinosa]
MSYEYIAAPAFDATQSPPKFLTDTSNDNNRQDRKHRIVIAVLPKSGCNITSVAKVTRLMLYAFPNTSIGLLGGVGDCASGWKHDIRLGKLLVSNPHNRGGGVLQYSYCKSIQNR